MCSANAVVGQDQTLIISMESFIRLELSRSKSFLGRFLQKRSPLMRNEAMEGKEPTDEEKYPSVGLAYDIALKSYDWSIQRLNAVDDRIDKLLTWISSITLGVVAFVGTKGPVNAFRCNAFFLLSMIIFAITVCFGLYTRHQGSLKLISPRKLYGVLHESSFEFRKNTRCFPG